MLHLHVGSEVGPAATDGGPLPEATSSHSPLKGAAAKAGPLTPQTLAGLVPAPCTALKAMGLHCGWQIDRGSGGNHMDMPLTACFLFGAEQ